MHIHTFESFTKLLASTPHLKKRKLFNNTYVSRDYAGSMVIRYHNTDIIVISPENNYLLNSGGWRTVTTKARMSRFTPARIYQEKHVWYISPGPIPFFDGIIVDITGQPINATATSARKAVSGERTLQKQIDRMITKLIKLDHLPEPNHGDCWGCLFAAKDGQRPLGSDCVLQHLKEGYLHGSLILRAMQARGHTDVSIAIHWNGWRNNDDWSRQTIVRTMRMFLRDEAQKEMNAHAS